MVIKLLHAIALYEVNIIWLRLRVESESNQIDDVDVTPFRALGAHHEFIDLGIPDPRSTQQRKIWRDLLLFGKPERSFVARFRVSEGVRKFCYIKLSW